MAKKIEESPTIADTVLFFLETCGTDGLLHAPKKINRVTISKIEKGNDLPQIKSYVNTALEDNMKKLRQEASVNPCQESILKFRDAYNKLHYGAIEHNLTYREAVPVHTFIPENEVKKTEVEGVFKYEWEQKGLSQGEYVIQWTWTTTEGDVISQQTEFYLWDDRQVKTSALSRYTPQDKYEMLINLYMPEMYKGKLKNTDVTANVINNLNWVVAQGFTMIEDFANRLMDMVDPSLTHENMLPLMANFLNLRLKSDDPVRWRRQIMRGIPLYKRRGTLLGLTEALDQAGIRLLKITKLWQIVSQYKWTDGFVVRRDGIPGVVVGNVLGHLSNYPHDNNYTVKIKSSENPKEYINAPQKCVRLVEGFEPGKGHLAIWNGTANEPPIHLYEKDVVLISYELKPIPKEIKQLEDYLDSLPLMDQSDPCEKVYPPKNWNTRLIEDDDPMFDLLIKERQPFVEPVVFGKIRTTFMYSEKAYNMDTYDGSLRDSYNYCDIDKNFMDMCSYCQSSKFNADVEIEDLSDSRVQEAMDIIEEYSPFHAQLHFLNISGAINEFVVSPIETIESLATVMVQEKVVPTVADEVTGESGISYVIEYADGTKENGVV